jgi:hypothetical protein
VVCTFSIPRRYRTMNTAVSPREFADSSATLSRHAVRRSNGMPTVSLLVGPIGTGARTWRRWAAAGGRSVVVENDRCFPYAAWTLAAAGQADLPVTAVWRLAQRAERDPTEFLAAWRAMTSADRERFRGTLAPSRDDDLLCVLADFVIGQDSVNRPDLARSLSTFGESGIPAIVRLDAAVAWPSVLFIPDSNDALADVGDVAARFSMQVPTVPVAIAVTERNWDVYLKSAPESRTKALLKEGELVVAVLDPETVERTLTDAGVMGSTAAAVAASGADAALVESAVAVLQATAVPPQSESEQSRARSAAEQFLFEFLESLPETAGKFELNGALDFRFGRRPAEVDILCRSPRVAIELDGHYHFQALDNYRRDRAKDWELQRRGFVVLRFLAEDVITQLETIRDRILEALSVASPGADA